MSDIAIFAAGIATMGLSLTLLVGLFPRLFFAEHDRQVAERAWDACRQAAYDETGNDYLDDVLRMADPYRASKGEQK